MIRFIHVIFAVIVTAAFSINAVMAQAESSAHPQKPESACFLIVNMELRTDNTGSAEFIENKLESLNYCSSIHHWSKVDLDVIKQLNPPGIILSGQGDPWDIYPTELDKFKKTVRETELPILGICGGHQFLALAFDGGTVDRIKRLKPGTGYDGCYMEKGFLPVRVIVDDCVLGKKGSVITVREGHYDEVKNLPYDFEVIASNDLCKVQAMRHKSKPVYGTQFHPEGFNDANPDGKFILDKFLEYMIAYELNPNNGKTSEEDHER